MENKYISHRLLFYYELQCGFSLDKGSKDDCQDWILHNFQVKIIFGFTLTFISWRPLLPAKNSYILNNMGGSSETQNVQRGIIMVFFINFLLLTIYVIIRFCKKQIDALEDERPASKKYEESDNKNEGEPHRQSQENLERDFDRVAVKRSEVKQDATIVEKFLHGVHQFVYFYCPFLILLPLNILTGTSKAFSLTLFFIITVWIALFNFAKLHRKLADSLCLNVVFENVWIFLCFFYCVNQWAATPIAMPYIVLGS